jgi:hypothetical protein
LGPFVLVVCLLFWAALAAAIVSLIMMGKPIFSAQVDPEDRIWLAAPGLVLFCGNMLLLLHLSRKLIACFNYTRVSIKASFFFEKGVPLPHAEDMCDDDVDMSYVKVNDEEILF